jgi:hypothetical protein
MKLLYELGMKFTYIPGSKTSCEELPTQDLALVLHLVFQKAKYSALRSFVDAQITDSRNVNIPIVDTKM